MTEYQQPVWVESDGVSNLPPKDAVGVYKLRGSGIGSNADHGDNFSYFNGKFFHCVYSNESSATNSVQWAEETGWFEGGEVNAWWDYQGLMAKPQTKDEAAFGLWVRGLTDGAIKIEGNRIDWSADAAVMATDEPGITAMAERNKPEPDPEKVVVGGLTIDMADLVEFLKAKQPKPEPNTTPRGILTMWNESADHRLGMWRTME